MPLKYKKQEDTERTGLKNKKVKYLLCIAMLYVKTENLLKVQDFTAGKSIDLIRKPNLEKSINLRKLQSYS